MAQFTNEAVEAKYKLIEDTSIFIPNGYRGKLSDITEEGAAALVAQKHNFIEVREVKKEKEVKKA